MKAKYCDRCKKIFSAGDYNSGAIIDFWSEDIKLDLCNECRDSLDEWLFSKDEKSEDKK